TSSPSTSTSQPPSLTCSTEFGPRWFRNHPTPRCGAGGPTITYWRQTMSSKTATAQLGLADEESTTYSKVAWRLLPFLFLCYMCAYLDRINVSFAKLQMVHDLGLSDAVYGLGAGIFFVGYLMFEVPSNLILLKVGARRWIARIMITWGLTSAIMMFVSGPISFYASRFLLGVAEAGVIPALLLYLSCWVSNKPTRKATARLFP